MREGEPLHSVGQRIADHYVMQLGPDWPLPVRLDLSRGATYSPPSSPSSRDVYRTPQPSYSVEETIDEWERWPVMVEPSPDVSPISVEVQVSPRRQESLEIPEIGVSHVDATARLLEDDEQASGWTEEGLPAVCLPSVRFVMNAPGVVKTVVESGGGEELWKKLPVDEGEYRVVESEIRGIVQVQEGLLNAWNVQETGDAILYRQAVTIATLNGGKYPEQRWRGLVDESMGKGVDMLVHWLLNTIGRKNIATKVKLSMESNVLLILTKISEHIRRESSYLNDLGSFSGGLQTSEPNELLPLTGHTINSFFTYCITRCRGDIGLAHCNSNGSDMLKANESDAIHQNIVQCLDLLQMMKCLNCKAFHLFISDFPEKFVEFLVEMLNIKNRETTKSSCHEAVLSILDGISNIMKSKAALENLWKCLLEVVSKDGFNVSIDPYLVKIMNYILHIINISGPQSNFGESFSRLLEIVQWICVYDKTINYSILEILLEMLEFSMNRVSQSVIEHNFNLIIETMTALLNTVYGIYLERTTGRFSQPRFYPVDARSRIFHFIGYLVAYSSKLASCACFFMVQYFNTYCNNLPAGAYYTELGSPLGKKEAVGLFNGGSTCYMNSVLQQLFQVARLKDEVLIHQSKSVHKENLTKNQCQKIGVLQELELIFLFLSNGYVSVMKPERFWSTFKFGGRPLSLSNQEDACEFLSILLDNIDDGLQAMGQSPVSPKVFGGDFLVSTKCDTCQGISSQTDPFLYLVVGVRSTVRLDLALFELFEVERMEKDNAYHCQSCSKQSSAVRKTALKTLPLNLAIQLKRFDFTNRTVKHNNYFEFPEQLDMALYLQGDQEVRLDGQVLKQPHSSLIYQLRGYVVHSGIASGGHYFSIAKSGQKWMKFNDETITEHIGDHKQYFGSMDSETFQPSAYLLFYERVTKNELTTDVSDSHVASPEMQNQISNYLRRMVNVWPEHHALIYQLLKLKMEHAYDGVAWNDAFSLALIDLLQCGFRVQDETVGVNRSDWEMVMKKATDGLTFASLSSVLTILCQDDVLADFLYHYNDDGAKKLFVDIVNRCLRVIEESKQIDGSTTEFIAKLSDVIRTCLRSPSGYEKGRFVGRVIAVLAACCPKVCKVLLRNDEFGRDLVKFIEGCRKGHTCRIPVATLICKLITDDNKELTNSSSTEVDEPMRLPEDLRQITDIKQRPMLHNFLSQIIDNDCLTEEIILDFLKWLSWTNVELNEFILYRFLHVLRFSSPVTLQMVALAFLEYLKTDNEFHRSHMDRILTELLENHDHFERICEKRAYALLYLFNKVVSEVPHSQLVFQKSAIHRERFRNATCWLKAISTARRRPQYWEQRVKYENGFSNYRNPGYLLTRSASVMDLINACDQQMCNDLGSQSSECYNGSDMSIGSEPDLADVEFTTEIIEKRPTEKLMDESLSTIR